MVRIFKYILDTPDSRLRMPQGARLLHVAAQGTNVCLWAQVDDTAEACERRFAVVGTGFSMPNFANLYVGTAHLPAEGLVLHVFEALEAAA